MKKSVECKKACAPIKIACIFLLVSSLNVVRDCISGSINFGFDGIVITSSCCSSDLCNSQDAPVAIIPSPNGKTCFQYYCISVNGNKPAVLSVCMSVLPLLRGTFIFGGPISCCQGNLFNSASSTTAGLLLSVAPLISLIWFF
uniref:UPAR/Ly6 domain-containing protein n=1 Tax=Amphilophus citrinellus TaxID=61819 RepID=A0A3Q0R1F3_AMPCI